MYILKTVNRLMDSFNAIINKSTTFVSLIQNSVIIADITIFLTVSRSKSLKNNSQNTLSLLKQKQKL